MPCRELRYAGPADHDSIRRWLDGRRNPGDAVEDRVRAILRDVRDRGDEALVEYTKRFDCPDFDPARLRVTPDEIRDALAQTPQADLDILREAIANIRSFHQAQLERSWWTAGEDGSILGQLVRPVDRVGLYVPGGQGGETPLVSSLLMNAIPAQVAGVTSIAAVSPPRKDGSLNPYILAAASLLGIEEILRVGSAWAVAALVYGTPLVAPVDVVAGPGNIYVTTAKQLLMGQVGVDIIAGPSEIAILADDTAKPDYLAADMLSQAEHDPLASAVVVTPSRDLADRLRAVLAEQLDRLPRSDIARQSLADWGAIVITPDLDAGIDLVNRLASEHLELATADNWGLLGRIRHAGAIFMGDWSPEPVGDYFAGPNHVLPTLGAARFSSALSVSAFCKRSSLIACSRGYVQAHGAKIARLARLEGLEAHARSVEARLK